VELPLRGREALGVALEVRDVVRVDEVGTVTAASEVLVGGGLVEDALAAGSVDAGVARAEEGRIEQPRAVLVGVLEADPLVQIGGRGTHSGAR